MALELIEYRKGSSKKDQDLQKLAMEKEEITIQNMQMQQQNKVLQQQLMQMHEKHMKSNQLSGLYGGGPMGGMKQQKQPPGSKAEAL